MGKTCLNSPYNTITETHDLINLVKVNDWPKIEESQLNYDLQKYGSDGRLGWDTVNVCDPSRHL